VQKLPLHYYSHQLNLRIYSWMNLITSKYSVGGSREEFPSSGCFPLTSLWLSESVKSSKAVCASWAEHKALVDPVCPGLSGFCPSSSTYNHTQLVSFLSPAFKQHLCRCIHSWLSSLAWFTLPTQVDLCPET
jgi:hypothetical protein